MKYSVAFKCITIPRLFCQTHCQKLGTKWRTRFRNTSSMAPKSCKEIYGKSNFFLKYNNYEFTDTLAWPRGEVDFAMHLTWKQVKNIILTYFPRSLLSYTSSTLFLHTLSLEIVKPRQSPRWFQDQPSNKSLYMVSSWIQQSLMVQSLSQKESHNASNIPPKLL